MRSLLPILIFAAILAPLVQAQKPHPRKKPHPHQKVEKKSKPVPVVTAKEAAQMLKEHKQLYKKRAPLARRLKGVELLGTKQSEKFISPLAKIMNADPNSIVRAEAAKSLSRQRFPKARSALVRALRLRGKKRTDQVLTLAILEAIDDVGYARGFFEPLAEIFGRESTEAKIQQQIVRIFDRAGEKRAFRLLVDSLDEPHPENVDDPSNPPASYWEMRWRKWDIWRLDVAKALKNLTGIEFKEAKYYKKWARVEGRKRGIKY